MYNFTKATIKTPQKVRSMLVNISNKDEYINFLSAYMYAESITLTSRFSYIILDHINIISTVRLNKLNNIMQKINKKI